MAVELTVALKRRGRWRRWLQDRRAAATVLQARIRARLEPLFANIVSAESIRRQALRVAAIVPQGNMLRIVEPRKLALKFKWVLR